MTLARLSVTDDLCQVLVELEASIKHFNIGFKVLGVHSSLFACLKELGEDRDVVSVFDWLETAQIP